VSPKVTVACPVYNADEYLELALESLLDQSFRDYEIFISDNGSTDRTEEICRAFADRDDRVRYVRSEVNHGLSWNWNTLIAGARGTYFKCAAHDDLHARDNLLRTTEVLDERPDVVLCYPKTMDIDAEGRELGVHPDNLDLQEPTAHERLAHLLRDMRFCNPIFGLMRTEVLRSTGWMRPYGKADRVLLAEMSLRGKYVEVPEILFYRRLFSGRSLEKYAASADLDQFMHASTVRPTGYPWTRLFAAHVGAIGRAPLPAAERVRCFAAFLREWRFYRGAADEFQAGFGRLVRRR
jgi:glycosyltransferase involved in cell wall biosynthesis